MKNVKLKEIRQKNKLTQIELSKLVGIHERVYQSYEAGNVEPKVQTAIRIADALQVKSYKEFKKIFQSIPCANMVSKS